MKNLAQFLQDDSTQRFSAFRLVLLAWAFGTLITWSYLSIRSKEVKDLPQAVQIVLVTLMAGKVAQKFGENTSHPEGKLAEGDQKGGNQEENSKDSNPSLPAAALNGHNGSKTPAKEKATAYN